jgi:hypothetical protein
MSKYICFTKIKHLIFLNGGSIWQRYLLHAVVDLRLRVCMCPEMELGEGELGPCLPPPYAEFLCEKTPMLFAEWSSNWPKYAPSN